MDSNFFHYFSQKEIGVQPHRAFSLSRQLARKLVLSQSLHAHQQCVNSVRWNTRADLLISGSDDRFICIWDYPRASLKAKVHSGHSANIFNALFMHDSSDRRIVTCGVDHRVCYQDLEHDVIVRYSAHDAAVHKLCLDPFMHDVFYSCSEDGTVKWFDLRQKTLGTLIRVSCTSSIGDRLYSMSLDPMSGYKLVVGGEGSRVSEFDIRLCKSPSRFYEPSDQIPWFWGVTSVAHSSDGRRLAVSFGGTESQIHLLDLYDPSPEVRADSIIFDQNSSPEEIPAPKKYRELNGHQNDRTVKEVTFIGPNSEIVASGSDCGHVFLWDSKSGILLNRLKGDSTIVNSVSGHPSAMSIAVSGLDSQVRIFEPYSLDHEVKNDFEDELSFPSIFMHVLGEPFDLDSDEEHDVSIELDDSYRDGFSFDFGSDEEREIASEVSIDAELEISVSEDEEREIEEEGAEVGEEED